MGAAAFVTAPPLGDGLLVRRVLVVPGLWVPWHHRPAVAALAAFAGSVALDGIVFLEATGEPSWEAFVSVVAAFRAVYRGPIAVHGPDELDSAALARLSVALLPSAALVAPGWRAVPADLVTLPPPPPAPPPATTADAAPAGDSVVCGETGRLRLTGRALPGGDGEMRAWLVFECGTLAADPAAGTLGFGILEIGADTVTARPVRIGADGSFTYRGTRYRPPAENGENTTV
jgi:hypothetical protein